MAATIQTSAISSMNYFFLRIVAGTMNEEAVNEEVSSFIERLAEEHGALDDKARNAIKKELFEGNYFKGLSITEVKDRINDATERLTGEQLPEVTRFYTGLIIENQRI